MNETDIAGDGSSTNGLGQNATAYFHGAIAALPVAIYACDINGNINFYNNALASLFGRSPIIGTDKWTSAYEMFDADGRRLEPDTSPLARTLKTGTPVKGEELIIRRPDGETKYVESYPTLIRQNGEIIGASDTLIDVTDRYNDDTRQARLAAIIESSEDAIISKTLDGTIRSWNKGAERLFGYSEDEVVGKHISILIPSERLSEEDLIISKIRNAERVEHFETYRRTKSGLEVPISLTVSPIRNSKGTIIGGSKIARDISRQKVAEDRLQRYAESLEILNSVGRLIAADLDIQSILQKVTDATTQLTGAQFGAFFHNVVNEKGESYTLFTLSGAPREAFEKFGMPRNTDVFHPTFSGQGVVRIDDITKDPRYGQNDPHYGMPTGHLPVVSYLAVPVFSKTGEAIGGLFFGHPEAAKFSPEHETLITAVAGQASIALDNAKLYEEIKQLNNKKDEFIGMASHELKTPITSLQGYLQIIERNFKDDDRNKPFITKARQQISKITLLISDLLDVAKIQAGKLPLSFSDFDIVELTRETIAMMQHSSRSHQLIFNATPEVIQLTADHQRIEQVIINLISNAVKYSPNRDKVLIDLQLVDGKVRLAVQDFGLGIDEDKQSSVFSRFYRVDNLAAHISGLGIGLYICHEIITRHQGTIWLDSTPGEGSTFYFEIPVDQQ